MYNSAMYSVHMMVHGNCESSVTPLQYAITRWGDDAQNALAVVDSVRDVVLWGLKQNMSPLHLRVMLTHGLGLRPYFIGFRSDIEGNDCFRVGDDDGIVMFRLTSSVSGGEPMFGVLLQPNEIPPESDYKDWVFIPGFDYQWFICEAFARLVSEASKPLDEQRLFTDDMFHGFLTLLSMNDYCESMSMGTHVNANNNTGVPFRVLLDDFLSGITLPESLTGDNSNTLANYWVDHDKQVPQSVPLIGEHGWECEGVNERMLDAVSALQPA